MSLALGSSTTIAAHHRSARWSVFHIVIVPRKGTRERLVRRVIDPVALPRCLADYWTGYCWLTWYNTVKLQVPAAVGSTLKVTWLAPVGIVMVWFVSGVVQFGSE